MRALFLLLCFYFFRNIYGDGRLCENSSLIKSRSCSTQIFDQGHGDTESCRVDYYPQNSVECKSMSFGPITSNSQVGDVSLKPYMLLYEHKDNRKKFSDNFTVLNITFSNIKWKTMKFRFQRHNDGTKNHCRNIEISNNVTLDDQSVLYYDCYWSSIDRDHSGHSHILDYEAMDDNKVIKRGRYFFNIPAANMIDSSVSINDWKPFVYIEIQTSKMKLHILPPPNQLKIRGYRIEVMKESDKGTHHDEIVKKSLVKLKNITQEVVYEYDYLKSPGSYYFVVTPKHDQCANGSVECNSVESPRITISTDTHHTLNICIASVTALIVATLFAYYIVLRLIRKYWCKDYEGNKIPTPPQILVVYSPTNKLHTECVKSFVNYLRLEYCFEMMYDGDICSTSHGDPFIWVEEAFNIATHVMYIVGPSEGSTDTNEQPVVVHRNVDNLQLNLLRMNRGTKHPKHIINVFFEYSTGKLPLETKHGKTYFLLRDWQKLMSYLSKNILPKQQMKRTERGKCLLEDLDRAKKLLLNNDVVIKCENMKMNSFDKVKV